ncbi:GvpL/GvpF family gas vesicle protein [Actinopolymorpha sp. NPDC004070]|uniref:GvpL/GvpF family gas vesicle protein n=1 Tax=Actinopolymorpha sp. NPDC004070 TaxID=3154548 RepID=UPI0033A4F959
MAARAGQTRQPEEARRPEQSGQAEHSGRAQESGQAEQPASAVYVYGILAGDHPCDLTGLGGVGDPPATLRRLQAGRVVAVVSDAPPGLRAKRRDVQAHQTVLDHLGRQGTVLPMRFGVVATDEDSLRDELASEDGAHLATLDNLTRRAEINVKVFCDEDELIRTVAEEDPTVRRLRAHATSVDEQIQLGEAVAAAIEDRERALEELLLAALGPLAVDHLAGSRVRGAAVNESFLVDDDRAEEFAETADHLDAAWGPAIRLQRSGPLPPYSFVTTPDLTTEPTRGREA